MGSVRDSFGAARSADSAVGRVVRVDGMVLVPVLAMDAGVMEAGIEGSALPAGAAGSAALELLGVWIATDAPPAHPGGPEPVLPCPEDVARPWLPASQDPPAGAESWSSWLAARPELLARIRLALDATHPPHAKESD